MRNTAEKQFMQDPDVVANLDSMDYDCWAEGQLQNTALFAKHPFWVCGLQLTLELFWYLQPDTKKIMTACDAGV